MVHHRQTWLTLQFLLLSSPETNQVVILGCKNHLELLVKLMYTYNDAGADCEVSDGCVTDQVLNYLNLFRLHCCKLWCIYHLDLLFELMYTHNDAGADGEVSDGYVTDQAINYLDLFNQSKGLSIHLNQNPIKRKGQTKNWTVKMGPKKNPNINHKWAELKAGIKHYANGLFDQPDYLIQAQMNPRVHKKLQQSLKFNPPELGPNQTHPRMAATWSSRPGDQTVTGFWSYRTSKWGPQSLTPRWPGPSRRCSKFYDSCFWCILELLLPYLSCNGIPFFRRLLSFKVRDWVIFSARIASGFIALRNQQDQKMCNSLGTLCFECFKVSFFPLVCLLGLLKMRASIFLMDGSTWAVSRPHSILRSAHPMLPESFTIFFLLFPFQSWVV